MACTVQSGTKTATTTSNFAQVFGTETIQTVEQSLKFMRKFTAVGISSILYIRTDLPDDSFALKELDGVRVSMLTTRNPVAKKICDGIQNGMNALKDGYLKELAVVFVKKDTDDIVETHSFKYILPNEIKKSKKNSAESDADVDHLVKIATRKLMHNMSSNLQICDGLPNGTQMLIRLQYTPETPEDYNPTGYVSLSPNSGLLKFPGEEEPVRQSFGTIDAKFYKVKLQMQ